MQPSFSPQSLQDGAASFSSSSAESETSSDLPTVACQGEQQSKAIARQDVGTPLPLTDEQREAAIHTAGDLFLRYWAKYEATGDFQYRGDADRALQLQRLLIAGRSLEAAARIAAEEGR